VCRDELTRATALNKRIVPIVARAVTPDGLPPELTTPNWISFTEPEFDAAVETLVRALDTDLDWLEAHARYAVLAGDWIRRGRDSSFLLRGADLRAAESWLAEQGSHAEAATPMQVEFVVASRRGASRRRQILLAAVVAALGVSIVLGVLALLQRNEARRAARIAASRALAFGAMQQQRQDSARSLLLGLEAYRLKPSYESRNVLMSDRERLARTRIIAILRGGGSTAAISPDGRVLLSATADGMVRFWDLARRLPIGPARSGSHLGEEIDALAVRADGKFFVTASADTDVRVWNAQTGERFGRKFSDVARALAFRPDGTVLMVAFDTAKTWDPRSGAVLATAKVGNSTNLAFDQDGTTLAAATSRKIVLWGLRKRRPRRLATLRDPSGRRVGSTALARHGRLLAAQFGRQVVLWSLAANRPRRLRSFALPRRARPASFKLFFGRGDRLLGAGDDRRGLTVWRLAGGGPEPVVLARIVASYLLANHMTFSPDGTMMVTGGEGITPTSDLVAGADTIVWDLRARPQLRNPDDSTILDLAFSDRGRALVSLSEDGFLRRWNLDRGVPIPPAREIRGGAVWALAPDGRTLAVETARGAISLWNLATGGVQPLSRATGERLEGATLAFSADGKLLAAGGQSGVRLWDQGRRQWRGTLGPIPGGAYMPTFSPDGKKVAVLEPARSAVTLWDVNDRKELAKPVARVSPIAGDCDSCGVPLELRFTPDGRKLAVGSVSGIALWDAKHRTRRLLRIGSLLGAGGAVFAFNRDGAIVLGSTGTETSLGIGLWDTGTGEKLGDTLGDESPLTSGGPFYSVAVDPNTGAVAAGGEEGAIRVWKGILWRDDDDLRASMCRLVVGNLTRQEWRRFAPTEQYHATCG
jgi:WD40 repeat protein